MLRIAPSRGIHSYVGYAFIDLIFTDALGLLYKVK
jgi:hypothetical protein